MTDSDGKVVYLFPTGKRGDHIPLLVPTQSLEPRKVVTERRQHSQARLAPKMAFVAEQWTMAAAEMKWEPSRTTLLTFADWALCIEHVDLRDIPHGDLTDEQMSDAFAIMAGILLDREDGVRD